jgi:hypothetical protein
MHEMDTEITMSASWRWLLLMPGMQLEALWVVAEPISCIIEQLRHTVGQT